MPSMTPPRNIGPAMWKVIEPRLPINSKNMANQPVMKYINHRVENLPMAEMIDKQSFFFGCHEHLSEDQREGIVGYFKEFFAGVRHAN